MEKKPYNNITEREAEEWYKSLHATRELTVNDEIMSFTLDFKYLGATINFRQDDTQDISLRIEKGAKVMGGGGIKLRLECARSVTKN